MTARRVVRLPLRVGAVAWLLGTAQFLLVHLVVESRWTTPFSWSSHTISDLGTTTCGTWDPDGRYVCSPWHAAADTSFVLTGLLLVVGVVATRGLFAGRVAHAGTGLLAAAGVGWALAGVFPADVSLTMHVVGANLILLVGNVGLVLVGLTSVGPARGSGAVVARRIALVAGVVGVVGEVLFLDETYLGLGMGGMERVAALPQLVWTAGVGAWVLATRVSATPTTARSGRRPGPAS